MGISKLNAILEMTGEDPFLVEIDNASLDPFPNSFCDDFAYLFKYRVLVEKCKEVILPMIRDVDSPGYYKDFSGISMPLYIIVTDRSNINEVALANKVTYAVTYQKENPEVEIDRVGIVQLKSDSFTSRQLLVNSVQYKYIDGNVDKVQPNIVNLIRYMAPEMEHDFNIDLHCGTKFIDALELAASDNDAFNQFKSQIDLINNPVSLATSTYAVFFSVWYGEQKYNDVTLSAWRLRSSNPAMYGYIEELSRIEDIGDPMLVSVARPLQSTKDPAVPELVVPVTPVLLRYLLEATQLDEFFGRAGLDDKHIIEIGGGYGGFAVALQTIYRVRRYSIVDLPQAGRLQQRYVREVNSRFDRNITVESISSASSSPVTSDVLISFFAISELRKDTVDKYMSAYVAHAENGFLQLNFDDDGVQDMVGNRRTRVLYSALEMFKLVYKLHPTAVLLPPPEYHFHHRIMWRSENLPISRKAEDSSSDHSCGCDCISFTAEYLAKLSKSLNESRSA